MSTFFSKLAAVTLLGIILCSNSINTMAQDTPEFSINDVPVLVDAESNILYVSLLPDTEKSFKARVTTDDSLSLQFALGDGSMHYAPHRFNIADWQNESYTMRILQGKKEKTYQLVFTKFQKNIFHLFWDILFLDTLTKFTGHQTIFHDRTIFQDV